MTSILTEGERERERERERKREKQRHDGGRGGGGGIVKVAPKPNKGLSSKGDRLCGKGDGEVHVPEQPFFSPSSPSLRFIHSRFWRDPSHHQSPCQRPPSCEYHCIVYTALTTTSTLNTDTTLWTHDLFYLFIFKIIFIKCVYCCKKMDLNEC